MNFFKNFKNRTKAKLSFKRVSLKTALIFSSALLVLILFYLCLSFFLQVQRDTRERTARLKEQFQNLISDQAERQHGGTVTFHQIQLKRDLASKNKKVVFSYSLSLAGESGGENLIEGSALLEKSHDERDLWLVRDFHIKDSLIRFEEPLVIPSGKNTIQEKNK